MSWHLTTGELTILAPLVGAPVGAAITYFATRRTSADTLTAQRQLADQTQQAQKDVTEANLKAQRELESAKRLWEKRADFYPGLIEELQRRNLLFSDSMLEFVDDPGFTKLRADHFAFITKHMSLMVSWPGQDVMNMWAMYFSAHRHLDTTLDLLASNKASEPLKVLCIESVKYAQHYASNLIIALRAELKGEEPIFNEKPEGFKGPVFLEEPAKLIERFRQQRP